MTTPHKDADKLIAIAHGKQMQIYGNDGTPWVNTNPDRALVAICAGEPCRVKPEFVLINGVECPKPNTKSGRNWVSITCANGRESIYCFDSVTDAIEVYEALIKPFKECQE